MPASSINLYHMHDAKNNFNAVRPAPLCSGTNSYSNQCQNIHISTNCYYGYHDAKRTEIQEVGDCEMVEISHDNHQHASVSPNCKGRKRSAEDDTYIQNKRLREDVSSMCSLVGTRSSPSHSASAFNVNISTFYVSYVKCKIIFKIHFC